MLAVKLNANAIKRVVLLGTWHQYQEGTAPTECIDRFRQLQVNLCQEHSARAIAEELSKENLDRKGISESTSHKVAAQLMLNHQYADPGPTVRKALGIQDESDVLSDYTVEELDDPSTKAELDSRLRVEYAKRERYWMEQITGLNCWPLLFVCGADHTQPFFDLLSANQFDVQIAIGEWKDVDME